MSRSLRYALAVALAAGLVAAAGCGGETAHDDIAEGETFELGELRYNILYFRNLNPEDREDAEYLEGQPPPPLGQSYFAAFLLIDNLSDEEFTLPDQNAFEVSDTTGAVYEPIESDGLYEFPYGSTIEGDGQVPDPDSTAAYGPIQGSMILFLMAEAVSESRPLEMSIKTREGDALVQLDL